MEDSPEGDSLLIEEDDDQAPVGAGEDGHGASEADESSIDRQLEEAAAKTNLSVVNVKSILHVGSWWYSGKLGSIHRKRITPYYTKL